MHPRTKALIELNVGVFVMTLASIFAKLIPWSPLVIISWRMLIAGGLLCLWLAALRQLRIVEKGDRWGLVLTAFFLAFHWITYFTSLQVSTVAIGILAVNTIPIFTTFIEPFFSGHRIQRFDIGIAVIAFAGIACMVEDFTWGSSIMTGVFFGLISAMSQTLRNICSKPYVRKYGGQIVMCHQLVIGGVVLSPLLLFMDVEYTQDAVVNVFLLALLATAVAHTLMLGSMKEVSARTMSILTSILPVYGIVLAFFVLGEVPSVRVVLGGAVLIGAVMVETLRTSGDSG